MSKTAIITGANKGIGLAVAKDLITKNYQVILACRDTACLLYTSPSPRDGLLSRMASSA